MCQMIFIRTALGDDLKFVGDCALGARLLARIAYLCDDKHTHNCATDNGVLLKMYIS